MGLESVVVKSGPKDYFRDSEWKIDEYNEKLDKMYDTDLKTFNVWT